MTHIEYDQCRISYEEVLFRHRSSLTSTKWRQILVQYFNHFLTLLLFILRDRHLLVQETVQICLVHEDLQAYKVQQREQLSQPILRRGACDEQPPVGDE